MKTETVHFTSSLFSFDAYATFTMPAQDVTLTATYEDRTKYNIHVSMEEGGQVITSASTVAEGETVTVTIAANQWYTLDELIVDGQNVTSQVSNGQYIFEMPSHAVEISAVFKGQTFSISYLGLEDGQINGTYPVTYTYGIGAELPNDVTRDGFTFLGWYDAQTGGYKTGSIGNKAAGDKTFYARWEEITAPPTTYIVTYLPGTNGNGMEVADAKTEGEALMLRGAIFTRTGHKHIGWATTDGGEKAYDLNASYATEASTNLYPVWEAETYSITYETNGGTINGTYPVTYTYGVGAELPDDATRDGYTFLGSYSAPTGGNKTGTIGDKATGDKTFYAYWEEITVLPVTYTVTFVDWDGTELKSETVEEGKAATALADPSRKGYAFTGWDVAFDDVTSNLTVMAQYEPIPTYTLFVENGTGSGNYAEGASVTITANGPETGKRFQEWTGLEGLTITSGSTTTESVTFTMPAHKVELTAVYEDIPAATYTITFESNDGTGVTTSVSGISGAYALPECTFTAPSGMRFKAWSVNGSQYAPGAVFRCPPTSM